VNQVMGDRIMALLGARWPTRTMRCARAMRRSGCRSRSDGTPRGRAGAWRDRPYPRRPELGEVIVPAPLGSVSTWTTRPSPTTHLAARMEQLAEAGSIPSAQPRWSWRKATSRSIGRPPAREGLPAMWRSMSSSAPGSYAPGCTPPPARGLTALVGRDNELDQLRQPERAQAGHGPSRRDCRRARSAVRLHWSSPHSHRARGWLILEMAQFLRQGTAYLPVRRSSQAYFQSGARRDAKIGEGAGKVLSLDRALEPPCRRCCRSSRFGRG